MPVGDTVAAWSRGTSAATRPTIRSQSRRKKNVSTGSRTMLAIQPSSANPERDR